MRRASSVLSEACTTAAVELVGIVSDVTVSPYARVQAAQASLQNARAFAETTDLVDRVDELEAAQGSTPDDLRAQLRLILAEDVS